VEDPAFGALLALKADVFKLAGIPEGVEIAFQRRRVVDVAHLGEDTGSDSFGGDAAVAVHLDADDQVLLAKRWEREQQQKGEQAEEAGQDRATPPNSWKEREWSVAWATVGALVAAEARGAHKDILMRAMNRNYLEKLELGKR